ncbi:MAG: tail fiber domain-containing protein [Spirochaetales bacterium]|nr:tail fiber domain-containing protein [Spirochaetales bacterium]
MIKNGKLFVVLFLFILIIQVNLFAETISYIPYSTGNLITAEGMNTRFSLVYNLLTGNLESDNIASGAVAAINLANDAVDSTKLAYDADSLFEITGGAATCDGTDIIIGTSGTPGNVSLTGHLLLTSLMTYDSSRPGISEVMLLNGEIAAFPSNPTDDGGLLRLRAGGQNNAGAASYIDLIGYVSDNEKLEKTMFFGTGGVDRMMIDQNGCIGIGMGKGINDMFSKLNLNGSIFLDSDLWASDERPAVVAGEILSNGEIAVFQDSGDNAYDTGLLRLRAGGGGSGQNAISYIDLLGYTNTSTARMYFGTQGLDRMCIDYYGRVGIGNGETSLDYALQIGPSDGTFSKINPGETTFTTTSSREYKENISPVQVDGILEKIAAISVMTYDFKSEYAADEASRLDRLGLIAEDFHTIFARGSDKQINGQEVQMALWLAVQELKAENEELRGMILESRNE